MIKKQYKCQNCGCEFVVNVFGSREEAEEFMRRNPNSRPEK